MSALRKALTSLGVVVLTLLLVFCSVDPRPATVEVAALAPVATPTPDVQWDPRLDGLNVTLTLAGDCSAGCWRLRSAQFEDSDESGGLHHIFARITLNGQSPAGLPWHVAYSGGDVRIESKAEPEWADFPMYAEYDPDEGQSGPYFAYAGDVRDRSDIVWGMGLPERQHVNFRLRWEWEPPGGATPVPTVTATWTPEPCAACDRELFLPLIRRR